MDRYSKDARLARAVERNSSTPMTKARNTSPTKPGDGEPDPSRKHRTCGVSTVILYADFSLITESVSEPRHPGPKARPHPPLSSDKLHDVLQQKIKFDIEERQARQAESAERLKISRERLELDKKVHDDQFRLQMLKAADTSTVLNEDTKEKLNEWFQKHFS